MASVASNDVAPDYVSTQDMLAAVEALRKTTVTMAGQDGHFVSKKRLSQTGALLRKYVEQNGSDELSAKLASEVSALQDSHVAACAEITKRDLALKDLDDQLVKARAATSLHNDAVKALNAKNGEAAKLKVELAALETELGKAKALSKKAMKGYDPSESERLLDQENALRDSVRALQSQRKIMDKEASDSQAAAATAKAEVNNLIAEANKVKAEVTRLKSHKAMADKGSDVPKVSVDICTPMVKLLIGEAGLKKLSEIDYARRVNLRDYASSLLTVANSSARTRTIGDLLKLAIEWMKQKAFAAREAIRPWLNTIEEHLRQGVTQSVSFYRDELKKIIGDYKANIKEQQSQYKGRPAVTQAAFAAASVLRKTRKRWFSVTKMWGSIKRAATFCAEKITTAGTFLWSSVFGGPVTGQTLFDEEEELLGEKVAEEHGGSEPPPPPPPPTKDFVAAMRSKLKFGN